MILAAARPPLEALDARSRRATGSQQGNMSMEEAGSKGQSAWLLRKALMIYRYTEQQVCLLPVYNKKVARDLR
eukprot:SAG11_NODE_5741_length_1474_cov_0.987636_2_plen_73_part_00